MRLRALCAEVGFDLDDVRPSLIDRLRLLDEYSATVDDAERMVTNARAIFRYYSEHRPAEAFSESEQRIVSLGCLLSDVGKSGPAGASAEDQRLIVEMFAVEDVPDNAMPVRRFIRTYFPDDAEARITRFCSLGLDPAMSIREFWNLHSGWTLSITNASGVPSEVVAAAASHHLLDGVNPESIVREDGRFSRDFGDNKRFDRAEKLVILLDKYDAVRRRGQRTHDDAIAWLRARLDGQPHVDAEAEELLTVVDEVLGVGPTSSS